MKSPSALIVDVASNPPSNNGFGEIMTSKREEVSISRIELVFLARLSVAKPPSENDVVKSVQPLAMPLESPAQAKMELSNVLLKLRKRGWVQGEKRALTAIGKHALREAFSIAATPTWEQVREAHLPALSLGAQPKSAEADKMLKSGESIAVTLLRKRLGFSEVFTAAALCDAILLQELGLPSVSGKLTLGRLRTLVLARRFDTEPKGKPDELVKRLAVKDCKASTAAKRSFNKVLGKQWIGEQTDHTFVFTSGTGVDVVRNPPPPRAVEHVQPRPPQPPKPPGMPTPPDTLLNIVREALPRVGSEGRFGDEKVFVSAIWRGIEKDRRLSSFSLERFKRWLLTANRDGKLLLARADLVGAMNANLVAESEIEDQGATFHFVLDRNATTGAERRVHAR
jgi:hypothetical protein